MAVKVDKIFSIIIEVGWLLIFILSPIFFAPFVYGVWQVGEYFLFQVLVEIILFVWLAKIIIIFFARRQIPSIQSPSTQFPVFPAVIFIVILGLATIFSQSPTHSFWGYYFRKMGYLIWVHFFAFFLILFFNLKTQKQIARIFYVIVLTVVAVVIYGFLQTFGFDIFPWNQTPSLGNRIFSTLGQPNFLGSWLLLSAPVIIWILIGGREQPAKKVFEQYIFRPLIISLFLLCIFILVLTQSRGAWVGFFFSFFFFTVVFSWLQKQKRLTALLLIFFVLCCVLAIYLNLHPLTPRLGDSSLVVRLKTLSQLLAAGELRLIWWRDSWDLIKQKPILGYGPETQHLNFIRYYTPEFAALETINSYPDRAHNDFLDMLLISGVLGLVSYLFLIISTFWLGLKYVFKKTSSKIPVYSLRFMVLILLAGLVGYLISLQFSFHVIPTAVYFWGYLAVIFKIANPKSQIANNI